MSQTKRTLSVLLALVGLTAASAALAQTSGGRTVLERLFDGDVFGSANAEAEAAPENPMLLAPVAADALDVELWFLPADAARLESAPAPGAERLAITGAYSSGERFAPEGFVIRSGDPTHPYPQGWDGLLLVEADGAASIHDVSRVRHAGATLNLREADERKRFVERARRVRLSAIQSHLLINEGRLDLRPVDGAKRFRRRVLFETKDGKLGVYDSSPALLTLYQAAEALQRAHDPRMALNLDMGAYDFCERAVAETSEKCGLLGRAEMEKLTNLLVITRRAASPD